uniref:Jerky protein homolog-like n=1 Tax=Diabrotica virgifera virgifera TaxID=50390 RepID=A0A6P7GEX9_DIAVI
MNATKSAVSLMFAATATGERLPLYVVYKAERLYDRWITDGPPRTLYNRTKSGWFDASTFQDWFFKVVLPWSKRDNSTKVLIGDNLSSHLNIEIIRACQTANIRFVFLPPNSTGLTQPLDVGFFRPLKRAWKTILTDLKTSQPNLNSVEKTIFP